MSATISPGAELKGRYRLERLLGHGGMASVWLGHDLNLDREVAIKVLSDAIAFDPEFMARFRREARVAAGLSHPNLVGVYDFSEGPERPYLVMEYVPGENLAARFAANGPIDCRRLATELLDAVAHIHAAGIVHRDIKPQNIVLAPDDTVKLIDFGIALPLDATSLTRTGLVLGTERYAAPEVRNGMAATERSDLYSCGVVLRSCPGGSPALGPLIGWLTSEDPKSRPASARQALAQLRRRNVLAGATTQDYVPPFARDGHEPASPPRTAAVPEPAASAPRTSPSFPPSATLPSRRTRFGAAAAVLAALAVFALIAWAATSGDGEDAGLRVAGAKQGGDAAQAKKATASEPRSSEPAPSEAAASVPTSAVPEPAGSDAALGSALNREGFEMVQEGRYEEAVPVLEESVRAFPPGTEELEYAYALFNLGNALRLSGRPEEAIPVLERRLEIPDQTDVVQRELDAARREAG